MLRRFIAKLSFQGVGKSDTRSTHYVDIFLSSLHEQSDDEVKVRCYVVDNILPVSTCQDIQTLQNKPEIRVLSPLADSQLGESGNVDILLSITDGGRCNRYDYYQIDNQMINIHRTIFGWTVGGASPSPGMSAVVGRVSCQELSLSTNKFLASFLSWRKFQRKIHTNLQMKLPLCNISQTIIIAIPLVWFCPGSLHILN